MKNIALVSNLFCGNLLLKEICDRKERVRSNSKPERPVAISDEGHFQPL